jgi:hypothetical protein
MSLMSPIDTPLAMATSRGHTLLTLAISAQYDLELAYAPNADLDATFDATCLDTGELLRVNGWLFCFDPLSTEP